MNIKTILAGTLLSLPAMSFVADASGSAESIIERHKEAFKQGNMQKTFDQIQRVQQRIQEFTEAAQEHRRTAGPLSQLGGEETYQFFQSFTNKMDDLIGLFLHCMCDGYLSEVVEVPVLKNELLKGTFRALNTIYFDLQKSMKFLKSTGCANEDPSELGEKLSALKEAINAFEPCVTDLTHEFKTLTLDFSQK